MMEKNLCVMCGCERDEKEIEMFTDVCIDCFFEIEGITE